jgi:integrase
MGLTATQIKSLHGKPQVKKIEKSDRDSLSIVVSKKGNVSFYYRFRHCNRQQRMCIGQYPILSLSDARDKVLALRKISVTGKDPRVVTETIKSLSLDQCIDEWMIKRVERQLRPKTQENYRSVVKHLQNKFSYIKVEEITAADWLGLFDSIAAESQVTATSVLRTCKSLLRWCIRRQLIPDAIGVLKFNVIDVGGKTSKMADRVLTVNEVREVLLDTQRSGAKPNMKAAVTTLFVMGCRGGELNTMQWSHLHDEGNEMIWIVPAGLSKTGVPIRRPVPQVIRDVFEQMALLYGKSGFIFSADPLSRTISISTQAIGRQLKRTANRLMPLGLVSGYFRPHDTRRTLVTNLADQGIGLHVLEKHLGHKLVGVMSHYQKSDWIGQQRESYELWSKMIIPKIVSEK